MNRTYQSARGPHGKADRAEDCNALTDIPSVGPALAADLHLIGMTHPSQLLHRNAFALYLELCNVTGQAHAPWVLDCFLAACDFMQGAAAIPWWHYTSIRERRYGAALRTVLGGATFIPSVRKPQNKRPVKNNQIAESVDAPDAQAYPILPGSGPLTFEDAAPFRSMHGYAANRLNGESQYGDEQYRVARLWLSEHLASQHPTSSNLQDKARSGA
jgi:hypothetical protein